MLLEDLRIQVLEANLEVVRHGLVLYTFGNASGISPDRRLVAIKPSGVPYERMTPADLVITDIEGNVVEGSLRPSSDLPTHLELYRRFESIGGVVHTHSAYASSWAQARLEIPCLGTTHADYFYGPVPVTETLGDAEIETEYELNTGHAIVRRFASLDPVSMPAVLVSGHAPFTWGRTPMEAARHAVILEEVAKLAYRTVALQNEAVQLERALLDKHFLRKNGPAAYYGQK